MNRKNTQNDLRYIKTEKLIRNTFQDMLSDMDYEQISIKELTEKAMINRKTFYLHYNSLDELLGKLQSELYTDFFRSISDLRIPKDLAELIRALFLFWTNTDGINEKILCSRGNFPIGQSPGERIWKNIFFQDYRKYPGEPDDGQNGQADYEKNIIGAYLSGSFIFIYQQWVADGRRIPTEDIIAIATRLITRGYGYTDG